MADGSAKFIPVEAKQFINEAAVKPVETALNETLSDAGKALMGSDEYSTEVIGDPQKQQQLVAQQQQKKTDEQKRLKNAKLTLRLYEESAARQKQLTQQQEQQRQQEAAQTEEKKKQEAEKKKSIVGTIVSGAKKAAKGAKDFMFDKLAKKERKSGG